MDEDAKTLMAILALIYGSSNGIGLFKTALDDVQKRADELKSAREQGLADATFLRQLWKKLWSSLWSINVIIYVAMIIVPPLFLVCVVRLGPDAALSLIGLGTTTNTTPPTSSRNSPFYWILLILSLLSSAQLLSTYLAGWRILITSWSSTKRPA